MLHICGWCLKNHKGFNPAAKIYTWNSNRHISRKEIPYSSWGVHRENTNDKLGLDQHKRQCLYKDLLLKNTVTQMYVLKGFTASIQSKRASFKMHTPSAFLLHHKLFFFIKDSFPQAHKVTASHSVSFYKSLHSWHQSNTAGFQTTKQQLAALSC